LQLDFATRRQLQPGVWDCVKRLAPDGIAQDSIAPAVVTAGHQVRATVMLAVTVTVTAASALRDQRY
jgi:hypothetical protein